MNRHITNHPSRRWIISRRFAVPSAAAAARLDSNVMPISDSTVNGIMAELPTPEGDYYTVMAPHWFAFPVRGASVAFGIAALWFIVPVWKEMPLWSLIIACIVVTSFVYVALNSKGWIRFLTTPLLHADHLGIYLPSHQSRTLGEKVSQRWLFVPWGNISDVRVDKTYDGDCDGRSVVKCAAIDVVAASDEIDEFFFDLTERRSNRSIVVKKIPVGFYKRSIFGIPGVKVVVDRIALMMNRHKNV